MSLLWVTGHLIDKADARVSPFDHGFLYGDGVWEHLRVFGGRLVRPADHLATLSAAADALGIDIPLSRDELLVAIETTLRANHRTDGYVRVIVTRGPGTVGPDPRKIDPQVIVIAEEYHPFPAELYDHGLHVVTSPVRVDVSNPALRVRALGQPHIALAKRHALRNGCLDAVLLDTAAAVVGCTEGSLFRVTGGVVRPVREGVTDVTRDAVIELARDAVAEPEGCGGAELVAAEEVFLAGTACGVIGIVRVDGTAVGAGTEGPVTRAIRERYRRLTRGE